MGLFEEYQKQQSGGLYDEYKAKSGGVVSPPEKSHIIPNPSEIIKNLVPSAINVAKSIASIVTDGPQIRESILNLESGLVKKAGRKLGIVKGPESKEENVANQAISGISGVVSNPGGYIEKDPVGAGMNIAGGLGLASKAAKASGLTRTASALSGASEATNPVNVAVKATTGAIKKSGAPEYLYESAMKIPPSVTKEIREEAIRTGLDYKYVVSDKGMEKLLNDIGDQNKAIAQAINKAQKTGNTIDIDSVVTRIDDLKSYYENYSNPQPYLDDLENAKQAFLKYHGKNGPKISPEKAQDIKKTIYAVNRKHYGEMKAASVEADKAIARGIKEELVQQYPELANLNMKDSALLNLEQFLERAVNRSRNYDVIKLGDTIMAASGSTELVVARRILESPSFKSKLAIALKRASRIKPPKSSFTTAPYIATEFKLEQ